MLRPKVLVPVGSRSIDRPEAIAESLLNVLGTDVLALGEVRLDYRLVDVLGKSHLGPEKAREVVVAHLQGIYHLSTEALAPQIIDPMTIRRLGGYIHGQIGLVSSGGTA